jgi:hypothetical protein
VRRYLIGIGRVQTLGEDVVRRVVRGQRVPFSSSPSKVSCKRKEVCDEVEFAFDVLGSDAAIHVEHFVGNVSSDHEVGFA